MLQKGKLEESKAMFKNLVESELLQKIDNDVCDPRASMDEKLPCADRGESTNRTPRLKSEIAARGTPVRRLQYLVYTNYASILEQSSDESAKSALTFYLKVWIDRTPLVVTV